MKHFSKADIYGNELSDNSGSTDPTYYLVDRNPDTVFTFGSANAGGQRIDYTAFVSHSSTKSQLEFQVLKL